MMAGFGHSTRTRRTPRSRNRMGPRTGPDRATLGIIGLVCAIAGFFVLGIVLGPVAIICGWLAMGRRWNSGSVPALVAVVLGAIDTLLAIVWLIGTATLGNGML
ncbi:small hydrophobic protein [Streptomyces hundungensis]|uniref:small hydrophobic protein n=1 Tax=Streptomyces hundungensis TaxID=1077946 RepID=UPI0033FB9ADF